ncbi:TetR/AcrR family transcriptional regulator [Clavibacter michiganensis]|uniref:TetR/AcrR family transcriptional regulator n=1 Tax=Clavibacter michiganensis TaxID=28447 RepID=UPI001BDFB7E2|nr:TetR/AcrR family transcriptional regulator [Clavibacter michiganensis]MBT1635397.1 TetR/AcrR family transcriptional regulator [Clavibacter michiganensis]
MDTPDAAPRPRVGRPVDRSGDAAILAAALDLVAERDYERMTLDEVAARTGRAKTTIYRRWATKEDLVLAALRAAGPPPEAALLPDTGSLRGDLLAVVDSPWLGGSARRLAVFAGLAPALRGSARMAAAIRAEVTDPYADAYRRILRRAVERGEVPAEAAARVDLLAEVIPAMSTHRLVAAGAPVRRELFVRVVDDVVLPALVLG